MKIIRALFTLGVVLTVAACSNNKVTTPIYAWEGINPRTDMEQLSEKFRFWKSQGLVGVCIGSDNPTLVSEAAKRAHAEGLESMLWDWA